jgi:hypothetical protein
MSSILLAVADALAADLTAHGFSLPFTAARTYADAEYQLGTADGTLQCDVVPASELKTELYDRGTVRYLASAFVVFRQKFAGSDIEQVGASEQTRVKASAVDPLVGLVEEANEWLTALERLTNHPDGVWNSTNIEAAVVHKHLREWSQFTGIIKTTYEVPKPL